MKLMLLGMEVALASILALFFLRAWHRTKDRFFAFFAASFALLAINWFGLGATDLLDESLTYFFWVLLGIADASSSSRSGTRIASGLLDHGEIRLRTNGRTVIATGCRVLASVAVRSASR